MLNKIVFVAAMMFASSSIAKEITVINGGSKAGVTFLESQEIANQLSKNHKVNFINPGNPCVAQSLVKQTKGPVLFIWDSTYEASARTNNQECQLNFDAKEIIRVDTFDWRFCSISPAKNNESLVTAGSKFRIGHANPASLFAETVTGMNSTFNTSHTAVHYSSGLGSLVTALQNKEIDYALMSPKFANRAQEQGVTCSWSLDIQHRPGLPSIVKHTGKNSTGLVRIFQVLLVGKNFDRAVFDQVKNQIKTEQETAGTNLNNFYKGLDPSQWNNAAEQIKSDWEYSVDVNIVKK